MALDHANYFIAQQHSSGEHWGGTFPSYSSILPFLTRFVTHFSAPGFFFLMGVGMLLFAESRKNKAWNRWRIIGHFWIRGIALILIQFFVINPIWKAGPEFFPETYIGVLVALGGTMIICSLLLNLSSVALLILTLGLLVGTEMLHPGPEMWGRLNHQPWNLILIRSGGDGVLWSNYPILPWLELVVFGILFGKSLRTNQSKTFQKGFYIGISLLVLFFVIRYVDGFGNIRPRAGDTWIDFLNVVKYPPSMAFTFLTTGVNLIVLWGFSKVRENFQVAGSLLVAFGSVPLFVYILHLALYMIIGKFITPEGTNIPVMFLYWLAGLGILYPLAIWYGNFKRSEHPLRWISSYL